MEFTSKFDVGDKAWFIADVTHTCKECGKGKFQILEPIPGETKYFEIEGNSKGAVTFHKIKYELKWGPGIMDKATRDECDLFETRHQALTEIDKMNKQKGGG